MKPTWRWFGEFDKITLPEIRQTGATGIVTALHGIPAGEVWPRDEIAEKKSTLQAAGFDWSVVESLPVHEEIKTSGPDRHRYFANYRQSLANLAAEGVTTVCYNFMPLLDWTRTDLHAPVATGGTCLRFDAAKMYAFERFMVGRDVADGAYSAVARQRGSDWFAGATQDDQDKLLAAIMSGLPGAFDRYDIRNLKNALSRYDRIGKAELRSSYRDFLTEILPSAEELGISMCVHPDDPPRDLLGLPRIVSTQDDIAWIMGAVDSAANGLTLCTGSLGAHPDNDLPAIASRFSERVRFAHLRNVRKEPDGSFEEASHLDGDVDLVAVVAALMAEEKRADAAPIPFRPDHGHELLCDAERDAAPGYPLVGRLRGMAELRGIIAALEQSIRT